MHNNPEEQRFQYNMTVGLKINRNRMPQVVNMKLHKMNNRKTDQDKNNKSGKLSWTRTWEDRFGCRSVIQSFKDTPYKVHMSGKGDLKLVQHAVVYKVNDDCYLTALNNYKEVL
jgi:hypothetical protein